ncbi:MAG: TrmH family RNA methyltransferase [Wujia sp.]
MPNIIHITDFHAPELDVYARLSEVQLLHINEPEKEGIFIAESPIVVSRAIDAGYVPLSILVEDKRLEKEALPLLSAHDDIPVFTAPLDVLTQLTGFKLTRGMLCAMKRKTLPSIENVCKDACRIAVLEDIVNPTNIGAIFRSAAALNMDAILLTPNCCDPLYRRSIRVSMGTIFQIPWTFLPNKKKLQTQPLSYVPILKQLGFKTVAMALRDDSVSIDDSRLMNEQKLAIILGTEGDGLAEQTIADCDYTARIPMSHGVDSLNVAAASAVAFWQLGSRSTDN